MFVVRELDHKLSFIFRLDRLVGCIWLAKYEAPLFARRGAHMTDRTNSRTITYERLSREKLLSMTTDTGVMVWKISDIREITLGRPVSRDLVAGIAGEALVLFR